MSPAPQAEGRRQQTERKGRMAEINRITKKGRGIAPLLGIYAGNVFSHDGSAKKK
jgi:hypothetical protein